MHTQVLVAGLGLAGTWVSYWLHRAGIDFQVIDAQKAGSSTPVASGVINPVTGRRLSTTWMAETLLPFAKDAYTALQMELGVTLFHETMVIDCFGAPDKRLAFLEKHAEGNSFLHLPNNENDLADFLHYQLGYGIIQPAYRINLQAMLTAWRDFLRNTGRLIEEEVQWHQPFFLQSKQLLGVHFDRLILCNGKWAAESGIFAPLPFNLNKGEALLIRFTDEPPPPAIYKKGNTLLPWQEGLWWAGSTYDNRYSNEEPNAQFSAAMQRWLAGFLKVPFRVEEHLVGIRPATVERRPFVGWHPEQPQVGILNGLGTKGVSLAPYFACQLVAGIAQPDPIDPQVDIGRYRGLLSRAF